MAAHKLFFGEGLKRCSKCREVKAVAEFGKNCSKPDGLQRYCKPCAVTAAQSSRQKHIEKRLAAERRYYQENRDLCLSRQKSWRERNPHYSREWEQRNPGAAVERTTRWQRKNMERVLAANSAYRAARAAQAIPLSDKHRAEITAVYAEAARLSRETGVAHHVDHIVPLNGENVSGLHVPWNLRAIPAADNIRKSNRLLEAA